MSTMIKNLTISLIVVIQTLSVSAQLFEGPKVHVPLQSHPDSARHFGRYVAIDGEIAVVGTSFDIKDDQKMAYVHIYQNNNNDSNSWIEVKKIVSPEGWRDEFCRSVAISGDNIIVGVPGYIGGQSMINSAYIYSRNKGGQDNWGLERQLFSKDSIPDIQFGNSVDIWGDLAIVGAPFEGIRTRYSYNGAAYIYNRNQNGKNKWGLEAKLVIPNCFSQEYFGNCVRISGDVALVGTSHAANYAGLWSEVYIYQRDLGGKNNWGLAKIIGKDSLERYSFSFDLDFRNPIDVSDNYVIIGQVYGSMNKEKKESMVLIFEKDKGGINNWGLAKVLEIPDTSKSASYFGCSVYLQDDFAIIGAPRTDRICGMKYDSIQNRPNWSCTNIYSSIYVFNKDEGGKDNWGLVSEITNPDSTLKTYFGVATGISGNNLIVGTNVTWLKPQQGIFIFTIKVQQKRINGNSG